MTDRPVSVTLTLRVLWMLTALAGVITVLVWALRDDLVLAWAEGNASASRLLAEGGLEAVEESLRVPAFVPVVVTSFVTFLMLVWVLAGFFKEGFTWARICLGAIALFGAFMAVLAIGSDIPLLFDVLSGFAAVLSLALLVLLLHPQTTRFCREV